MKRIILFFIANITLGLFFVSCNDLLEEKPKSVVVENFYKTPEEVESAVDAVYNNFKGSTMATYEAVLECLGDFVYGRGSWEQIGDYKALNDANITKVSGVWNSFYEGIKRANIVIGNSPKDNPEIDVLVSEARFLRAFGYFQLVRNWGGVPIRTEDNMSETDLPRSSESEVYDFILKDLLEAESVLPEKRSRVGKATKWAAKTLLADVYLHLGDYQKAKLKAEEIINSGKFSLVKVSSKSDFQEKVWGPSLLSTSEEIFYLKYSNNPGGTYNYMLWILNHTQTGAFPFGGAYAIHGSVENSIYKQWDDRDLRKQLWEVVDFGLGSHTLVSTKFIDKNAVSKNGGANDDPVYGYSDVLFIYAEALVKSEKSVSLEALEAINKIHRRAYGYDPELKSSVDFLPTELSTVDKFMEVLIRERGYEFQTEGKRWLELKRLGIAEESVKFAKGVDVSKESLLWPIPISEINYNGALDPSKDQNPGY